MPFGIGPIRSAFIVNRFPLPRESVNAGSP